MDKEKKIEKEFEIYQDLAKDNKKIDVASLMLNALQNQNLNLVSAKEKKWAYLVSVGLPPLGLIFAIKLYLTDKDDGRHVANVCVILTILSLLSFWLLGKMIFSSAGSNVDTNKLLQLNQSDLEQLLNQN